MANAEAVASARRFKPGLGYQSVLSIAFLLVVLFMVNAFAGTIWLARHHLPLDAVIFVLMFGLAGILAVYAGVFLFSASHSRVELGPDKVHLVLPNWRGPSPLFPYSESEIAYSDIATVETRGEIYRYFILPVSVRSASLVKKDGQRVTLGYMLTNSPDPAMPFNAIAAEIAKRAGAALTDNGVVEAGRGLRALTQDEPAWDAPELAPERVAFLEAQGNLRWKVLAGVGLAVAALAIGFQAYRFFGA